VRAEREGSPPGQLAARLASWTASLVGLRRRVSSPRLRQFSMWFAITVFVAAFSIGVATLPRIARPIHWYFFVLSGVLGAPLLLLLAAAEYDASARLVGRSVSRAEALRISVLSTAANLLPLPGSAIVRTTALRRLGTSVQRAALSTATLALSWVGTGTILIGGIAVLASATAFGITLCVVGVVSLAATYLILVRMSPRDGVHALFARIFLIEAAFVAVGSARFFLVLEGLRQSPSMTQAAALTLSGMVASMTGFFPSGLGIRELAAGAIGPLVDLPPAVGVVAASIVRLADLVVMAPLAAFLLRRLSKQRHKSE
jgi:hypothetical protein